MMDGTLWVPPMELRAFGLPMVTGVSKIPPSKKTTTKIRRDHCFYSYSTTLTPSSNTPPSTTGLTCTLVSRIDNDVVGLFTKNVEQKKKKKK